MRSVEATALPPGRLRAPGPGGDAFEHDVREPGGQARGNGDRGARRGKQHPGQDLAVHRTDDQGRHCFDVGGRVDPAQALLALQVVDQQVGQPAGLTTAGAAAGVLTGPGPSGLSCTVGTAITAIGKR